jgi:hypothetical protein
LFERFGGFPPYYLGGFCFFTPFIGHCKRFFRAEKIRAQKSGWPTGKSRVQ